MDPRLVLIPVIPLLLLVVGVYLYMAVSRFVAVRKRTISPKFYKLFKGAEEPEHLEAARRNIANLFESPVIFYMICILAYVSESVDRVVVFLAWTYVLARYVHSFVHLTYNNVVHRLMVFLVSAILLVSLCAKVFFGLLVTG